MLSSDLIMTTVLKFGRVTAPSLLEPINVSMKKGIVQALSFTKQDSRSDPLFKSRQLLNFTKLQTLHPSMFEWDLPYLTYLP